MWEEFEAAKTPDAIFARSLDRVQPVLQNIETGGGSWTDYDVTFDEFAARVGVRIARGAPAVWDHVRAKARRFLRD